MKTVKVCIELKIPDINLEEDGSVSIDTINNIKDDIKYRLESSTFDGFKARHNYRILNIEKGK